LTKEAILPGLKHTSVHRKLYGALAHSACLLVRDIALYESAFTHSLAYLLNESYIMCCIHRTPFDTTCHSTRISSSWHAGKTNQERSVG